MSKTILKSWLLHNLGLKISAFFLALIIWFSSILARERISFFHGEMERNMEVAVSLLQPPSHSFSITIVPEKVSVVVAGSSERLRRLSPEEIIIYADAEAYEGPGVYETPYRSVVPLGVRIVKVVPAILRVDLRKTVTSAEPLPTVKIENPRAHPDELGDME